MAYDLLLIDGDLPDRPTLVRGPELIAQRVRRRLAMHRGEWLLDQRVGVPYVRWRAQKPPRVDAIGAHIRQVVTDTPGVLGVEAFRAVLDGRTVRVTGRVLIEGGEVLELDAPVDLDGNVSPAVVFHTTSGAIL